MSCSRAWTGRRRTRSRTTGSCVLRPPSHSGALPSYASRLIWFCTSCGPSRSKTLLRNRSRSKSALRRCARRSRIRLQASVGRCSWIRREESRWAQYVHHGLILSLLPPLTLALVFFCPASSQLARNPPEPSADERARPGWRRAPRHPRRSAGRAASADWGA